MNEAVLNTRNAVIERIENESRPVYIRHGLGWKGATWEKSTKQKIIRTVNNGHYAHYDICNVFDGLGINFYSANDML